MKKNNNIIDFPSKNIAKNFNNHGQKQPESLASNANPKRIIAQAFDTLFEAFKRGYYEQNLEQIIKACSKQIDSIILEKESSHNYQYVGGEFSVICIDKEYFKLKFDLYFKNTQNEWFKVSSESKPQELKYLDEPSITDLRKDGILRFEIEAPKN